MTFKRSSILNEFRECECDDPVTSRRPHHIRSVGRLRYKRTPAGSLRHPLDERKNGLGRGNISTVRRNVTKGTGFILLSFRLEDLTLRLGKREIKRSLNVQI